MKKTNPTHIVTRPHRMIDGPAFSMGRRAFLMAGAAGLASSFLPAASVFAGTSDVKYPTLSDLTHLEVLYEPILKLRGEQEDPDPELEALIRRDVLGRLDLLARVKNKLEPYEQLYFNIDSLKIALHFVPELRETYARSYLGFCRDITDFIFAQTGIPKIYTHMAVPLKNNPPVSEKGITAFVVHQLIKRYVATCSFSTETGKRVRYRFKGDQFSSHKGAVALEIENPAPGDFVLKRKNFTIWQNHTRNPFTLFAIPVEETLHYLLGPHTDKKIQNQLHAQGLRTMSEVRKEAVHWMMVEEAVVGGMVHVLLEQYGERYPLPLTPVDIKDRIASLDNISQFKYRPAGIRLVRDLGYRGALSLYQEDPGAFESRLSTV